jgi:hypothetical protein
MPLAPSEVNDADVVVLLAEVDHDGKVRGTSLAA